jgi:Ca-activated chloride channel family protein
MSPRHRWLISCGVAIIAAATLYSEALIVAAGQADPATGRSAIPDVQLLSPAEDAYVTGPTRLRAAVSPAELASSAVFFVDGRRVCSTTPPTFECDWDAGPAIASHHVRLVVNLSAGGRVIKTVHTAAASFAETVDVDAVQVTVTVTDTDGRFVSNLPPSAFHVFEDDRPQLISHFASAEAPLELVVAIDMSESMREAMPRLKRAVAEFLAAIPPQHRVTLLGFNDDVFTLTRTATDPAERLRAVDRLMPWGTTVLYEGISRGVELLGRQTGRKSLLVFSDGEDRGSTFTIDEIEAALQASDLTLYMIGQGRAVTSLPLRQVMERLSRPTGGRAFFTDQVDALRDAFKDILDELSHQYLLGYQPTNAERNGTWRRIAVRVDGHDRVRARLGYRSAPRR